MAELANQISRAIPEKTKRAVRQKCGFGCIFCGVPVFDYEHLIDFAIVLEHDEKNINLLCPNHHRQKTSGLLSRDSVRQKALNPFNLSRDRTAGIKLEISGGSSIFIVGSNVFSSSADRYDVPFTAIELAEQPVLRKTVEDGWLLFDLILSSPWGNPILVVERGEISVSTSVWDFTNEGGRFTVRNSPRKFAAEMVIAGDNIEVRRGAFCIKDTRLQVEPDQCIIDPDTFYVPLAKAVPGRNIVLRGTRLHDFGSGIKL